MADYYYETAVKASKSFLFRIKTLNSQWLRFFNLTVKKSFDIKMIRNDLKCTKNDLKWFCVLGYVLFNSYSIVGVTKNNTEEEVEEQEELTVPIGK